MRAKVRHNRDKRQQPGILYRHRGVEILTQIASNRQLPTSAPRQVNVISRRRIIGAAIAVPAAIGQSRGDPCNKTPAGRQLPLSHTFSCSSIRSAFSVK
jgi:hypothetical protein